MFSLPELTNTGDWRRDRQRLQAARRELDEVIREAPGLSNYIGKKFSETVSRMKPGIEAGAAAEYQQAIKAYQEAERKFDRARALEIARWDIVKLQQQRKAIREMIDDINQTEAPTSGKDKLERLEALFGELTVDTQPPEIRRAAAEVFSNVTEYGIQGQTRHGTQVKYSLGGLAIAARQDLSSLRVTDEMLQADQVTREVEGQLAQLTAEVIQTGQEIGDDPNNLSTSPIAKAIKRVKWDYQNGGIQEILPEDHPDVTGVDLSKL